MVCRGRARFDNPAFCQKGSDHPSAKVFPLEQSGRQVAMLDPKTMKYSFLDTCFGTHHPQFGYDADNTLWLSGTGPVAGWINTKVWDETGDVSRPSGVGLTGLLSGMRSPVVFIGDVGIMGRAVYVVAR